MAIVRCPQCNESKRVSTRVGPKTEKDPNPIFRYECKACGHQWREGDGQQASAVQSPTDDSSEEHEEGHGHGV